MSEKTIIHTWENDGINYTLHSDLTVTSDKTEIQIKQFDPNSKSIVANGKLYMIERELSADRWIKQNQLEIELGFGMSYQELKNAMATIYNLANSREGKIADIGRISYDAANGVSKLLDQEPHILKFCSLFMNTVDEDRKTITDDQMSVKIADIRKEGFAIDGFFVFALSLCKSLAEDYRKVTQSVLKEASDLLTEPESR